MYEALGLCKEGKGGELIDNAKWIQNSNGTSHIILAAPSSAKVQQVRCCKAGNHQSFSSDNVGLYTTPKKRTSMEDVLASVFVYRSK